MRTTERVSGEVKDALIHERRVRVSGEDGGEGLEELGAIVAGILLLAAIVGVGMLMYNGVSLIVVLSVVMMFLVVFFRRR